MKQLIIGICMLVFANIASAQTTGSNSGRSTANSGTTKTTKKSTTIKRTKNTKSGTTVPLNERKEYKGKNGQVATPTGQEATGVNSGYSAIKKDTATKRGKQDQ
jgi:hypothetical protein